MSKYSDPITATGSLITFDAPSGGVFDSLSVPITPTQDLHGYSHPWPGGGGKNKWNPTTGGTAEGTYNGITYTKNKDGSYSFSGNATGSTWINFGNVTLPAGTWTASVTKTGSYTGRVAFGANGGLFYSYPNLTTYPKTVTSESETTGNFSINFANGVAIAGTLTLWIQIESGSTATSWSPYENICPISGRTGLSVYVSPTSQQAQATEYAVSFGSTVYAGFADLITGEVKERPQYPSCNGEVLVGPWMSSMDEYAVGVTPTTGAQVVDLGGALATASITPVYISMREGSNNVWVDTSAIITLIYRLLQVERKTDRTSIGKRAESLDVLGKFSSISKVEVNVTENLFYEAGDSSGWTLTVDCPFGTQAMANNLLAMLQGYVYQPFEARRSIANPATELGDGVTVGDVYGGIYAIYHKCGPLHLADLSAPADEEIDHEYKYEPKATRKIERQIAAVQSQLVIEAGEIRGEVSDAVNQIEGQLSVQSSQIAAKVSQTGGNSSSFGWQLLSSGFLLKSGNKTVFQANSSGITVTGQVNATSGYIGNGSSGFLIGSRSISNGKSSLSDGNYGVYIGTDGIALGPNFKVDSSGNLTANSGTFTGYVRANMVQSGGDAGYITGGQIGSRAISVGKCSYGINTSLGNADYSADVFSGAATANYMKANSVRVNGGNSFYVYGKQVVWATIKYKNDAGVTQTREFLVKGGI